MCLVSCGPPPAADCPSATAPPGGPWANTYGGPLGDKADAIGATPDGGLIVGGNTYSFGADVYDDWVLKLARGGEVLWQVRLEGSGTESVDAVAATRDGGAVIASSRSIRSGPSSRRGALLVARFDCTGELLWARTLAVSDFAATHALRDTPDGGFLLAGEVATFPELGGSCMVLKLSGDGNLEWQRAYGLPDRAAGCHGIALAAGGGYVLAGEFGRPDSTRGWTDLWLVKLSASGDVQWERSLGERDVWERSPAIREVGDGTFLVSSLRHDDVQLLSLDTSGATVWHKSYRAPDGLGHAGLWVSPDGSATIVGNARPDDERDDIWAMRVGALGDPTWSRRYGRETSDRGAGVAGFDDGTVVLAGTLAWGSPEDLDEILVLEPGSDGRVGAQGVDVPVTVTRMNVAPQDTAVRVSIPSVEVDSASVRVTRTQASVRAFP